VDSSKAMEKIYDELVSIYGPWMELGDLALVLRRNRNGIRNAVREAEGPGKDTAKKWAVQLADCKSRIGRKIMFRTKVVADLLEQGAF